MIVPEEVYQILANRPDERGAGIVVADNIVAAALVPDRGKGSYPDGSPMRAVIAFKGSQYQCFLYIRAWRTRN